MLTELNISNFAIIDELSLRLTAGFEVITGETGAGKSILIDAVDFALGGHSDAGFIRTGAEKAIVALTFTVPPVLREEIRVHLDQADIKASLLEPLQLTREIRTNGRSSARVNGQVCKLPVYREIGGLLVDIHGQTEHLSLLRPSSHIYLLDRYADLEEPRDAVAELVRKLHSVRQTMESIQQNERAREQRVEMLKYQIEEIDSVRLNDGEEEDLRNERNLLANSEKLAVLSEEVYEALFGEDEFGKTGVDSLQQAAVAMEKLATLDASLDNELELAESIAVQVEELADSVRRYRENIETSPGRLEDVEERLEVIGRLKRKYGSNVKEVLEYAENARRELEDIELGEERLAELQAEETSLLKSIGELGFKLSQERRKAGEKLSVAIVDQLGDLRMENARFEVSVIQEEDPDGCIVGEERLSFDATGLDKVEFLMTANLGEPMRPLAKVASGGETARIMLALKTVLSMVDHTPTLIFDEIDQGIGGRIGSTIGEKLWSLSDNHQVLCVTHLAQIAGYADEHFSVAKEVVDGERTRTRVTPLYNIGERITEMAEMLGGSTDASQQNAQDLIETAYNFKKDRFPQQQPKLM